MLSGFHDFIVTERILDIQEICSYSEVYIESLDFLNAEFKCRFSSENVLL